MTENEHAALSGLIEPWSNAACMGYCLIAMRRAGVNEKMLELEMSFDDVSIEAAEKAGMEKSA